MKFRIALSLIAVVGILIAVYYSAVSGFDFTEISRVTDNTPLLVGVASAAIILQFIGHWLRASKHKILLEQIRPVRTGTIFHGQIIGSLFNFILPFRLGELVRAHYVARGVSISRSAVFATILFERLLDGILLIVIGVVILLTVSPDNEVLWYAVFTLSSICLLLGIFLYSARSQKYWVLRSVYLFSNLFNTAIRDKIRMVAWSAIYALKNTISRRILLRYASWTGIMWIFYLSSTFVFALLLLNSFPISTQILASIAAYFGVSIPSGPAYLGTFQSFFTSISGVPADYLHDHGITLILWLLLVVPVGILGLILLSRPHKVPAESETNDIVNALKNKLYRDVDITKEFSLFLDAYFQGDKINKILTTEEVSNNFQVIKTFKGGSNALTLLAWHNERMVVKKITLKQYEEKLSAQYDWLKEREKFPQITKVLQQYKNHPDYYALDIEFRDEYIPFFDFIHSSSAKANAQILREVCEFVNAKVYKPVRSIKNGRKHLDKYIETKVIGKVADASSKNLATSNLLAYESLVINGQTYDNFDVVIKKIVTNKEAMKDLSTIYESPIHGDLTVDNLIVNPKDKSFIILDPNNENAISDPVVDYGKLMQSVHSGYEFLCSLASCKTEENSISFEEIRSVQYDKLHLELTNLLQEMLPLERYRTILFHEAVHYCRMLTYRADINPDTTAAFYSIAVRLFNEFIGQYE